MGAHCLLQNSGKKEGTQAGKMSTDLLSEHFLKTQHSSICTVHTCAQICKRRAYQNKMYRELNSLPIVHWLVSLKALLYVALLFYAIVAGIRALQHQAGKAVCGSSYCWSIDRT